MKDKLPKGWDVKDLGKVSFVSAGNSASQDKSDYKNGKYPFFRTSDIGKIKVGRINKSLDYLNEKGIEKLRLNKKGTILIPKSGASTLLNHRVILNVDGYVSSHLATIFPRVDIINNEYLFNYLKIISAKSLLANSSYPSLKLSVISKVQVPLPPLQEQEKIVKVLDATFTKIDKAITLIEQNITKLKQLNESVLDETLLNNNWNELTLEELTSKIGSGSTPRGGRSSYKVSGISLIRSMNVHDNGFKEKGLAFIDNIQAKKLSNVILEKNDVLLNITGASVARCCIVPKQFLPARVNQHVSILRSKKELILPTFLHLCLISPFYKNKLIIASGGGATREAITKTALCSFKIKLPNIKTQLKIVRFLTQIRINNHTTIKHYQNKLTALHDLKMSVLDSAFKGKLKRASINNEKEVVNWAYYQMQIIGASIQANRQDNIAQGEMAIAKDMYLLDRLYGINTKMNFVNHSWGPFAPEIKKRINNKQYFGRKNFPNSKATYVAVKNETQLLGKIDTTLRESIYQGIQDLNAKVFLKVEKYHIADRKELLATVLKCIEDTKSTDIDTIRNAMTNWKIKQGKFKTKADKFTENETVRVIQFIKKMKWDLKVIR